MVRGGWGAKGEEKRMESSRIELPSDKEDGQDEDYGARKAGVAEPAGEDHLASVLTN